ncbi:hypothetical protein [Crocosphaera sp.]|nr:hypothetical protein [Crocosphaera sp.]MDJ0583195.1 hypothetical protein [Crocosphaera sp.]
MSQTFGNGNGYGQLGEEISQTVPSGATINIRFCPYKVISGDCITL